MHLGGFRYVENASRAIFLYFMPIRRTTDDSRIYFRCLTAIKMFLAYCHVPVCVFLCDLKHHYCLLFPVSEPSNEEQRFPVPRSSHYLFEGTLLLQRDVIMF